VDARGAVEIGGDVEAEQVTAQQQPPQIAWP